MADSGRLVPADFDWDCPRLALNPRGTLLAAGTLHVGHVLVLDTRSGHVVARLDDLPTVEWLGFLSANVLLVSDRVGCTRFDLRRGTHAPLGPAGPQIPSVAAAPNGRVAVLGLWERSDLRVIRWDVARGCELQGFGVMLRAYPERLTISAGSRYLAADCAMGDEWCRVILIWDTRTGRRMRTLVIGQKEPVGLAFQGDTLRMAAYDGNAVHLFEPDQGEDPAATIQVGGGGDALAFGPGNQLAVLGSDGTITWLQARGRIVRRTGPRAAQTLGRSVANVDWSWFAATTAGGVFVWPAEVAEPIALADSGT